MLRRNGWTLPLLLGAFVCLGGCTFPKSFGFARKQQQQPETQVAEDRAATTATDAEAEGRKPSLAQSLRKTTGWFSFGRHKTAATDKQPLVDNQDAQATASQPLAYPNVVPPKYRNMNTAVPNASLAKDTSGTPSLVRPSRRPPPDPAPKPPLETRPEGLPEELLVEQPRADGPLYALIASASQSWRVTPSGTVATEPASAPPDKAASDTASSRPLVAETNLKFTAPDLSARERKTVTRPTDLVTNMLRPAKSAQSAAGKSTPTSAAHTEAPHAADSNTRSVPNTSWIAKNTLPSSATSTMSTPTAPSAPQPPSTTTVASRDAAVSTVVANTFGGTAGAPHSGSPPTPVATRETATEITRSQSALPRPKPAGPAVTIPKRSEAVARAETARQESPPPQQHAYLTKSPSQAHPNVPTRAAAPPEAIEEERLAPLVDADTYRAQFANTPSTQPVPVHTAARASTQPVSGSWVAAYQRLVQRTGSSPAPRPPAGSPTRTLSSDDEPAIPEPDTPILRR